MSMQAHGWPGYILPSDTLRTQQIQMAHSQPSHPVCTRPRATSCSAVALCPVTSRHMMMCSSRITWKEDRMGLQSSTGGERQGEPLRRGRKETTRQLAVPASCWLRALLSRQPLSCLSLSPLYLPGAG